MKLAFFSNYLTHHQLPFCHEMHRLLGDDFVFIVTECFDQERKSFGYEDMNDRYGFVVKAYGSDESAAKAMEIARTYDVVLFGAAPECYLVEREKENKLTFRYCERPLKKGRKALLKPKVLRAMIKTHTRYVGKPVYLLCAGAYVAKDFALVGAYVNKAYKWGYFPQVKQYDSIETVLQNKKTASLLWAGRLLDWKHPEMAVLLAEKLKNKGICFELNIIGNGELESVLRQMIEEKSLADCVHLLGSMPPDRVREYMEQSEIFLFTSDQNEGWGAVLNESMNSGCAVIANQKIGAVPYLLNNGENGLIYQTEAEFYALAEQCLSNTNDASRLGRNAYRTIVELWTPEIAVQRILRLSKQLLAGERGYEKNGPCSKAERI